jgi:hypothetical protein
MIITIGALRRYLGGSIDWGIAGSGFNEEGHRLFI